jgi:hypothetical protein
MAVTRKTGRLDAILKALAPESIECAVGFPENNPETKAIHGDSEDKMSTLDVAVVNNYGAKGVPRRDFMSLAEKAIKEKYKAMSKKAAKGLIDGKVTQEQFLELGGLMAVAAVQKAVTDLDTPPNSEATIKEKKSDNPLIDTGLMRSRVTYSVRKTQ